jgi:hypothetical protein
MTNERKETVQYITAISTLASGVLLCVLSFFLHEYDIETGVLMYFGQTLIFCGAVFGINMIIKTKVLEAETNLRKEVDRRLDNIDRLFKTPDTENENN